MDGFTDQLLTRKRGSHLQPNSLPDGGTPIPLKEAVEVETEIGGPINPLL